MLENNNKQFLICSIALVSENDLLSDWVRLVLGMFPIVFLIKFNLKQTIHRLQTTP